MHILSPPIVTTYALSVAFSAAGIVQLAGMGFVRRAYMRWGYPTRVFRMTGALELLAAGLLATSGGHLVGVMLAAAVNFAAVVLLLKNRAYLLALPGVAAMAALPFSLPLVN